MPLSVAVLLPGPFQLYEYGLKPPVTLTVTDPSELVTHFGDTPFNDNTIFAFDVTVKVFVPWHWLPSLTVTV
jgi:hypothetical protein